MKRYKAGLNVIGDGRVVVNPANDVITFVSMGAVGVPQNVDHDRSKAWIKFLSENFGRLMIVITDTLQWHSVLMYRLSMARAHDDAPTAFSPVKAESIQRLDLLTAFFREDGNLDLRAFAGNYAQYQEWLAANAELVEECKQHSRRFGREWCEGMFHPLTASQEAYPNADEPLVVRDNIEVLTWETKLKPPLATREVHQQSLRITREQALRFVFAELLKPEPINAHSSTLHKAFLDTMKERVSELHGRYKKTLDFNPKSASYAKGVDRLFRVLIAAYLFDEAADIVFRGMNLARPQVIYAYSTPVNKVITMLVERFIVVNGDENFSAEWQSKPRFLFHELVIKELQPTPYFGDSPTAAINIPAPLQKDDSGRSQHSSQHSHPGSPVKAGESPKKQRHSSDSSPRSSSDEEICLNFVDVKKAINRKLGQIYGVLRAGPLLATDCNEALCQKLTALMDMQTDNARRISFTEIKLEFIHNVAEKTADFQTLRQELGKYLGRIQRIINAYADIYDHLDTSERKLFDELKASIDSLAEFRRRVLSESFDAAVKQTRGAAQQPTVAVSLSAPSDSSASAVFSRLGITGDTPVYYAPLVSAAASGTHDSAPVDVAANRLRQTTTQGHPTSSAARALFVDEATSQGGETPASTLSLSGEDVAHLGKPPSYTPPHSVGSRRTRHSSGSTSPTGSVVGGARTPSPSVLVGGSSRHSPTI